MWRDSSGEVHAVQDCCPHLGALLSKGKVRPNGCLQCPYHGLCVGEKESSDAAPLGTCVEADGIIWWSRYESDTGVAPALPLCGPLASAKSSGKPLVSFELDVRGSYNDALRNAFDVYHPAFLHASSFGNGMGAPSTLQETWQDAETMRLDFEYLSNANFAKRTGKRTANHHVFVFPSTVYNVVEAQKNAASDPKSLLIHIAMRATSPTSTAWLVTAASDFIPHSSLLEAAVRRVAEREDAGQMANMASDAMKAKYAYRTGLPLDQHTAGYTFGYGCVRAAEDRLRRRCKAFQAGGGSPEDAAAAWAEVAELMRWQESGWCEGEAQDAPSPVTPRVAISAADHVPVSWSCLADVALGDDYAPPADDTADSIRNNIIPSPFGAKGAAARETLLYKSPRIAVVMTERQAEQLSVSKEPVRTNIQIWSNPDPERALATTV